MGLWLAQHKRGLVQIEGCARGVVDSENNEVRLFLDYIKRLDAECQLNMAPFAFEGPTGKQAPCASILSVPTKTLSVIIPAYNEQERLPATLQEIISYLHRRRDREGPYFTYEVIVVDDGSDDGTPCVAASFVRKNGSDAIRVLRLPHNRGKGFAGLSDTLLLCTADPIRLAPIGCYHTAPGAVKVGMLCSRGQRLLMMDADGATQVSDMERLEERLADGIVGSVGVVGDNPGVIGSGMVLGSRAHLKESAMSKRNALRNFLTHAFHLMVTMVIGNHIRDTQCGFKLFTRAAAQQLYRNLRLQRWCFDVELVYLAQQLKVPMAEVQVNWTEMAGSKIRPTSVMHMATELLTFKIAYTGGFWRLKVDV
ncbi:Dolichyl-phosphate beta-glucosyltransferase [Chlorella vulgaris]